MSFVERVRDRARGYKIDEATGVALPINSNIDPLQYNPAEIFTPLREGAGKHVLLLANPCLFSDVRRNIPRLINAALAVAEANPDLDISMAYNSGVARITGHGPKRIDRELFHNDNYVKGLNNLDISKPLPEKIQDILANGPGGRNAQTPSRA